MRRNWLRTVCCIVRMAGMPLPKPILSILFPFCCYNQWFPVVWLVDVTREHPGMSLRWFLKGRCMQVIGECIIYENLWWLRKSSENVVPMTPKVVKKKEKQKQWQLVCNGMRSFAMGMPGCLKNENRKRVAGFVHKVCGQGWHWGVPCPSQGPPGWTSPWTLSTDGSGKPLLHHQGFAMRSQCRILPQGPEQPGVSSGCTDLFLWC